MISQTLESQNKIKIAVIIANLGTPDEATPTAVRRFLREFLSDRRVIETVPKPIWQVILNCFILPFRPKHVAHAYQSIWQQDSPMRSITLQQVDALQAKINTYLQSEMVSGNPLQIDVMAAMSYGNPSIHHVLNEISAQKYDGIIALPLFPQYSATSTAPIYDAIAKHTLKQRSLPSLNIIRDYFSHPLYIQALADSVQQFWNENGKAEKLLMSFHGIPKSYEDKGDPYPTRCRETARLLAEKLNLTENEWAMSFQSRFGKAEWVRPYTDETLTQWAKSGVTSVHVISPAFSVDCLETLEELAIQNRDLFLENGGQDYAYIPALNATSAHIDLMNELLTPHIQAMLKNFHHR